MVGKKISPDMEAYLTDLKIYGAFFKYEMATRLDVEHDEQLKVINALIAHPERLAEIQKEVEKWRKYTDQ
ncbi:MAG: hypothetical protein JSV64_05115 [Candidatus Bathyarchaeota archaeon]|jgi:hypothetical protein|nr:MAG: hypothetical protein JSV64_05115 [Candidatus Bathyarchaeota archaeon]